MTLRPPRVLLAHSYYLRYDAKQLERMKPYPPLGTLLAAAVLRQRGYRPALFDAMLAPGVEAFEDRLRAERPDIVGLFEDNFNFLTKMCTVRMREAAFEMIDAAKRADALVAVNGSDATDRPELYLEAGADAVILGEVEGTALDLFERWSRGAPGPPDDIAGLALESGDSADGPVRRTAVRPQIERLDALPFPAWDLIDAERYRQAWTSAHGRFSWNMVTSRGCPYGCNWCAKPIFGRRYSQRGPASAAEEMRRLKETVAPDHIWFADDIFGLTTDWIEEFSTEVGRRGAATPFMIQSRVNLMKDSAVRGLAAAGCEEVWLGVESGSQMILDAMDKGTRIEQVRAATRTLREHGIRACWFIQLGYLGEEWDDVLRTRDLIRDERPDDVGVSVSYPLPGTDFYETVRRQLRDKQNWDYSGDLSMMFAGTYHTDFYRRVRDLLHDEMDAFRTGDSNGAAAFDSRWAELGRIERHHRLDVPAET